MSRSDSVDTSKANAYLERRHVQRGPVINVLGVDFTAVLNQVAECLIFHTLGTRAKVVNRVLPHRLQACPPCCREYRSLSIGGVRSSAGVYFIITMNRSFDLEKLIGTITPLWRR